MVRARFSCGHEMTLTGDEEAPRCTMCQDTRIIEVQARAPKFQGHARGPCAQFEDLPAKPVTLSSRA